MCFHGSLCHPSCAWSQNTKICKYLWEIDTHNWWVILPLSIEFGCSVHVHACACNMSVRILFAVSCVVVFWALCEVVARELLLELQSGPAGQWCAFHSVWSLIVEREGRGREGEGERDGGNWVREEGVREREMGRAGENINQIRLSLPSHVFLHLCHLSSTCEYSCGHTGVLYPHKHSHACPYSITQQQYACSSSPTLHVVCTLHVRCITFHIPFVVTWQPCNSSLLVKGKVNDSHQSTT